MTDVYFGNSVHENAHLKYLVPPSREGFAHGSVMSRELNGYIHDPESVMARIQAELDKNAERANKVVQEKTGHIAVADTVAVTLMPNKDEYWDDAPQVPPARPDRYSSF